MRKRKLFFRVLITGQFYTSILASPVFILQNGPGLFKIAIGFIPENGSQFSFLSSILVSLVVCFIFFFMFFIVSPAACFFLFFMGRVILAMTFSHFFFMVPIVLSVVLVSLFF